MLPWDGCILLGQPVVGLSNLKQVFFLIVSEDLCAIVIIWNFFRVCLLVSVRFGGGGGVVVLFFKVFVFVAFFWCGCCILCGELLVLCVQRWCEWFGFGNEGFLWVLVIRVRVWAFGCAFLKSLD